MNKPVVQLGPDAVKQVAKTVRENARRIINERPLRQRWQNVQPNQGCTRSYDIRILWNPSAGSCTFGLRYNSVTENITFDFDETHAAVLALVNAHSEFVAASVEATGSGAGSFPSSNFLLKLPSGAEITTRSETLVASSGSPVPEFRVDICGCS